MEGIEKACVLQWTRMSDIIVAGETHTSTVMKSTRSVQEHLPK